jgi:molybdopterin/thiamine biosynthesis adenylyltransferase
LPDGRIRIGTAQIGVGAVIGDDSQAATWRLLELMDGTRDRMAIATEMCDSITGIDDTRVYAAIERLTEAGFVEEAAPTACALDADERTRYQSNRAYFAWVDTTPRASPYVHQERLKSASITVLGLGGTGSAVAMSLAAAGVGSLHCVDFDRVEEGNLSRQLLYSEDDIGCSKVDAALARLRRLNARVRVTAEELRVGSAAEVRALMDGCDLFMLCADRPAEIQELVNEAALASRTPWIVGAYLGPMVVVGTYVPWETPCFTCFRRSQDEQLRVSGDAGIPMYPPAEVNATIAPAANLSGHFAALEALYLLAGLKPQTIGRIFHQNLMIYGHSYFVEAPRDPACPACGTQRAPSAVLDQRLGGS